MKLQNELSDNVVLGELGERIASHRLNKNMSQASLAKESGVSLRTMTRVEAGDSVQASSLIRIMRALRLLENLEVAIPVLPPSPVQMMKLQGKERQRASVKKARENKRQGPWSWGDDQ